MSKKIEDRLTKNKELATLISNLKGIGGDKPTKVKPPSKRKTSKNKSTGAIMKEVGDLFEKDNSEVDYNSDPGLRGAYDMPGVYDFETNPMSGWKKGGRLKKAKKKAPRKRAALRGQRSELRGS